MTRELWGNLFELKRVYPGLKITMFTVPLLCSPAWLQMVRRQYPWFELHYHGSRHEDRNEWFDRDVIELPYHEYFYRGFKSPWWRMNQRTADALNRDGYLISAQRGYFDVTGPRVYRFNTGRRHIKGVWFEDDRRHYFHSHVQSQKHKDGLPDIFEQAVRAFRPDSQFLFVNQLFSKTTSESV